MSRAYSIGEGRSKVKIVMLGDQSVGKTSLIEKFIHGKFSEPTVGIDFLAKDYIYKGRNMRLQLWDTAGQERFRSLIPSYLKDSHCAIIVFDLSSRQSLDNVESWLSLFKETRAQTPIAVLAGNKADVTDRVCQFEEVDGKAKQLGIKYIQVSAKTGYNLNLLFQTCLDQISQYSLAESSCRVDQKPEATPNSNTAPDFKQAQLAERKFALRNDILNIPNDQPANCRC